MNKKIALVALLLVAAAVGTVFAASLGDSITINTPWGGADTSVPIKNLRCVLAVQGINVSYDCYDQIINGNPILYPAPGRVEFTFTAVYKDSTPDKTWTNTENITYGRTNSTWRFALLNFYQLSSVIVTWRKI
ncbi:MAG: hypothetical protein LBB81_05380 [Treponema sp.]|nr:hypothetical protein [Treponema sp.]